MSNQENFPHHPRFENPPVIEVVMGFHLERLNNFSVPHFGAFGEKVRKYFPNWENAIPIEMGNPSSQDPHLGLPIPRVWYINKTKDKLLQLQINKFLFNWRRFEAGQPYPSYNNIKIEFDKYWKLFLEFLGEYDLEPSKINKCELTYINHIPKGQGWNSAEDISKLFPDLCWRAEDSRFLKNPSGLLAKINFPFDEDMGELSVTIKEGKRKIDRVPLLVLELRAMGLGPDQSEESIKKWFEMAHDWIVLGFADLTGLEIQKQYWGRL